MPTPSYVPSELVREFDFDFHGPLQDLFPRIDALRDEGRVLWLEPAFGRTRRGRGSPGLWLLTKEEDIRTALQSPALFSNAPGIDVSEIAEPVMIPISMDPPEHGRYRRIMTPLFSPPVVAKMEEGIRARIRRILDGIVDRGSCEFVSEVALLFPTGVFTNWIGLPEEDTSKFVTMVNTLIHGAEEDRPAALGPSLEALNKLIVDRYEHPTDDLMSQIAVQEVDGRRLTHEELLNMAYLLFLAGLDTVAAALSFSYFHLAQSPDDRRALAGHTVPTAQAVEELLRRHSFVNLARRVTRDVEFAGVTMHQGDQVICSLPLASRDPDEYDDPTNVRLDRDANRHFAFGAGPHRCVGSHLARLEMRIAFDEWHERIPDYQLDGEVTAYGGAVMGVETLPLRWSLS